MIYNDEWKWIRCINYVHMNAVRRTVICAIIAFATVMFPFTFSKSIVPPSGGKHRDGAFVTYKTHWSIEWYLCTYYVQMGYKKVCWVYGLLLAVTCCCIFTYSLINFMSWSCKAERIWRVCNLPLCMFCWNFDQIYNFKIIESVRVSCV